MPGYDYHRPRSLEEAWRLSAEIAGARFVAGGTDVMVRVREGKLRPSALISLNAIGELSAIDRGPPFRIGAGVRIADLIANDAVAGAFPVLCMAARKLGSVQIRNSATAGGNLCNASPCADLAPPLLVHEARVEIASSSGRRSEPLADFFVAPGQTRIRPGEIVTAIVVAPPAPWARAVFFKKSRVAMDIAIASICVLLELDGRRCKKARVAAGSLGPRPMRLLATERVLDGKELDDAQISEARKTAEAEVAPISDVRAGEAYRRHLAGAFVERAVRQLVAEVGA